MGGCSEIHLAFFVIHIENTPYYKYMNYTN